MLTGLSSGIEELSFLDSFSCRTLNLHIAAHSQSYWPTRAFSHAYAQCPREDFPCPCPREFSPWTWTIWLKSIHGLGAGGKKRGWFLMRWKVSFWQGLRAGQLGAEPQYQVPMHKASRSFLPSSAKSMDPLQWNCPCPKEKIENPKNSFGHGQGNPLLDSSNAIL